MIVVKAFSANKEQNRGFSIGIFKRPGGITCPPDR
jgi:hypothetical protein